MKISDEVERALRRKAAQLYGAKRGALSKAIEEAVRAWLSLEKDNVIYKAFKGDKLIAEASTLDELAEKVRRKGMSVRGLRVIREPPPGLERRLGLRARRSIG